MDGLEFSETFKSLSFLKYIQEKWNLENLKNLNFNTIKKNYIAGLIGFLLSVLVGLLVAFILMPPSPLSSAEKKRFLALVPQVSSEIHWPPLPTEHDFKNILKRNIFNSDGGMVDVDMKCELVQSSLPLKLIGVIFGGQPSASLVLLQATTTQEVDTFGLYEEIPGEAKIIDIEKDRVILEKAGCQEFIALASPKPLKQRIAERRKNVSKSEDNGKGGVYREDGFERVGNTTKVTHQWLDRALTVDFTKTLQDAKANPYMEGSEVKGFSLDRIRPDSVYEKMGLQNGDIVNEINGVPLNDAARAIQTLNAMRNESSIALKIKRNGQDMTFQVQVK